MIYAIGFIIVAIILIFIVYPRRGLLKKDLVILSLSEWAKEIHDKENYNYTQINHKVVSESKSVKITYDFSTKKGIYEDKFRKIKYKIIEGDGHFYATEKIN